MTDQLDHYVDCNFSSNDLDASTNVDPTKLYWSWLGSTFTAALADSDPNRLVLEQRLAEGEDDVSYRKEYYYDPGGNRLAMRESTYDPQEEAWNVWQITRYNYTYPVNWG
ncbi:MAG: hypothetical protein L6R00_18830, partial [Phycisphaerae bacterium]|nr:hypothetical protein [Phycisphaerae bacterium]